MQELPNGWTIRYGCPLGDVPPALLPELHAQLCGIVHELANLAENSGVWQIVGSAELHIQVKGWRFAYRVPHRGVLEVVGAHPIPTSEGPPPHPKRHLSRRGVENADVATTAPVRTRYERAAA